MGIGSWLRLLARLSFHERRDLSARFQRGTFSVPRHRKAGDLFWFQRGTFSVLRHTRSSTRSPTRQGISFTVCKCLHRLQKPTLSPKGPKVCTCLGAARGEALLLVPSFPSSQRMRCARWRLRRSTHIGGIAKDHFARARAACSTLQHPAQPHCMFQAHAEADAGEGGSCRDSRPARRPPRGRTAALSRAGLADPREEGGGTRIRVLPMPIASPTAGPAGGSDALPHALPPAPGCLTRHNSRPTTSRQVSLSHAPQRTPEHCHAQFVTSRFGLSAQSTAPQQGQAHVRTGHPKL